jgi:hypothetical protein
MIFHLLAGLLLVIVKTGVTPVETTYNEER